VAGLGGAQRRHGREDPGPGRASQGVRRRLRRECLGTPEKECRIYA